MHRIFPIDVDNIEEFFYDEYDEEEDDGDGDGNGGDQDERDEYNRFDDSDGHDADEEGLLGAKLKTNNEEEDVIVSNGQIEEEK